MRRLIAKQWYSDAPYEARMEDPAMWTKDMVGNYIEPSYSGIPQVKWDHDDETPVNGISMEFLRYIEGDMFNVVLEVTLDDGDTFRTPRIQKGGRREFKCKPKGEDKYRTFGTLDYERIEAVKE